MPTKDWTRHILKWTAISFVVGLIAGTASAFFLIILELVTRAREGHEVLIYFLPLGGILVGWMYHRFGRGLEKGTDLILEEIHEARDVVPLRLAPLVLLGTWITHLFGGSAGREGTAVQMGGSLADQLSKPFKLNREERKTLLMAGMSAGFGSVFGVPFAGAVFGLEVLRAGRVQFRSVFECTLASFVGHFACVAWGVEHTQYASPLIPDFSLMTFMWVAIAGLAFGVCARAFAMSVHFVSRTFKKIPWPILRPGIGGLFIVFGYWWLGTFRYAGLGVSVLQQSLIEKVPSLDFLWKFVFTVLTLGAGFKGGEVTPLLFIGSTFGNALSEWIPLQFSMLSALGIVAVFAGAANTPWACAIMAMELFGPKIGIFAVLVCWMSFLTSGRHGIYHAQIHR